MMNLGDQLRNLQQLISEGLEGNVSHTGKCRVSILGPTPFDFGIVLQGKKATFINHRPDAEDAFIEIDSHVLPLLLSERESLNFRDPRISDLVRFDGDLGLLTAISHSIVRPEPVVVEAFQTAEHKSASLSDFTIQRLHAPSQEEVARRIDACVPFIVDGLADQWPALKMDVEAFIAKYGEVSLGRIPIADGAYNEEYTIGGIAQAAASSAAKNRFIYSAGVLIPEPMLADFPPLYFGDEKLVPTQIWLGGGVGPDGPITPLHRDSHHSMLMQIFGRKQVTMFPPHQAPQIYASKAYHNYQHAHVQPSRPDLESFPEYAKATPIEIVLNPGELLVQPLGWFHEMTILDQLTLSVSNFLHRDCDLKKLMEKPLASNGSATGRASGLN